MGIRCLSYSSCSSYSCCRILDSVLSLIIVLHLACWYPWLPGVQWCWGACGGVEGVCRGAGYQDVPRGQPYCPGGTCRHPALLHHRHCCCLRLRHLHKTNTHVTYDTHITYHIHMLHIINKSKTIQKPSLYKLLTCLRNTATNLYFNCQFILLYLFFALPVFFILTFVPQDETKGY